MRWQNLIYSIAACIALAFCPLYSAFATERLPAENYFLGMANNRLNDNLYASKTRQDQQPSNLYYTNNHLSFSFSHSIGVQLSLYTQQNNDHHSKTEYQIEPQISLFKSSLSHNNLSNKDQPTDHHLNRYSKPTPVVYMLTLKGRSIAETAGDKTTMWSLDSAKKGVQQKAEIMFSITKLF